MTNIEQIKKRYLKLLMSVKGVTMKDFLITFNYKISDIQYHHLISWSKSKQNKIRQHDIYKKV